MAAEISRMFVRIGANITDLSKQLNKASAKVRQFGKQMNQIGKDISLKITAPIALLGIASLKTFGDFESSMNRVRAVTGATGKDMTELEKVARDLGKTTKFSANQAAKAMGFLGVAGFTTREIIETLPNALNLAAAAQIDVAQAADITSKIMRGFGIEAKESGKIADLLSVAFTRTNTDLTGLGEAFKQAGPVAKVFGLTLEETTALLGKMGDVGFQGSLAGTALKNAIVKLNKPSKLAKKIFKDLEISITNTTTGAMRPMVDILDDLSKAGLTGAETMEIFGLRGGPAMAALMQRGVKGIRDLQKELDKAGGTAARIAKIQMEGLIGQMFKVTSAINEVAIQIGEKLSPMIQRIGDLVIDWTKAWDKLEKGTKTFVITMAGLIAAIGPALVGIGALIALAGFAAGPLVSFTGGIIKMSASLVTLAAKLGVALLKFIAFNAPMIITVGLLAGGVFAFGKLLLSLGDTSRAIGFLVKTSFGALNTALQFAMGLLIDLAIRATKTWTFLKTGSADAANIAGANLRKKLSRELRKLGENFEKLTEKTDQFFDNLGTSGDKISAGLESAMKDAARPIENAFKDAKDNSLKLLDDLLKGAKERITQLGDIVLGGGAKSKKKEDQKDGKAAPAGGVAGAAGGGLGSILASIGTAADFAPTADEMEALLERIKQKTIETTNVMTEQWLGFSTGVKENLAQLQEIASSTFQTFASGFGDAIADMILFGESFMDSMKALFLGIAKQIITMLIKIGIQRVATAIVTTAAAKTSALSQVNAAAAIAFANAFAAHAGIPFVGIALGTAAGSAAAAAVFAGAAPFLAFGEGGVVTGPTLGLVGEKGPEAIIPLDKLDTLQNKAQTIVVNLDGRMIGRAAAMNLPSVLRVDTGIRIQ